MTIKQQLYKQCEDFLNKRLEAIQHTISEIQNSLLSETKSSAGDKHETGRAMLQLEREKAGKQLAEIQKVKETLSKINIEKNSETISLGCLVYTTTLNYFIAISAGEINYNNDKFYAISPSTPIAKLLLSKKVGEQVTFRSLTFTIVKIE
ncbi:GreA/GreB family elongation factor [Hyunsoonleella ulvae]|uniref:GreA/GreB family elongation factor n=1 Tax=Hyunsoonleella ulvae TaxID=2799948 RepID=UPI00193A2632|nr:GreA/GreB family elongation factor [Hyunsoonleella ulvae]